MVRPFEKPHGRLPRRPSVPSPSRNHHDRIGSSARPELVEGCAPFKSFSNRRTSSNRSNGSIACALANVITLNLCERNIADGSRCQSRRKRAGFTGLWRFSNLVILYSLVSSLLNGMDGEAASRVCTGNSLSHDRSRLTRRKSPGVRSS